jgi:purine-binding chemotaxis protein CheW
MPAWVEGVVDYHYRVIPVIDLRRRFSLPAAPLGTHARLLVLTARDEWIAVVVDQVLDVRAVREEEVAPPPPFFRGLAAEFLRGMTRRDDRLVVLLDPDRLFATHETLVLDGAGGGSALPEVPASDATFQASFDGTVDG